MFTGIIQEIGRIAAIRRGAPWTLRIACEKLSANLNIGDSVAVSGVCLTVVENTRDGFLVEVSAETIARSAIAGWKVSHPVNLEPAMPASGRFDGHIVQGHVDGVGRIVRFSSGSVRTLTIAPEDKQAAVIVEKGSIAVDGVSLTIAKIDRGNVFSVALIPLTIQSTTAQFYRPGDKVNLEYDIIGKYVRRYLKQPGALNYNKQGATL